MTSNITFYDKELVAQERNETLSLLQTILNSLLNIESLQQKENDLKIESTAYSHAITQIKNRMLNRYKKSPTNILIISGIAINATMIMLFLVSHIVSFFFNSSSIDLSIIIPYAFFILILSIYMYTDFGIDNSLHEILKIIGLGIALLVLIGMILETIHQSNIYSLIGNTIILGISALLTIILTFTTLPKFASKEKEKLKPRLKTLLQNKRTIQNDIQQMENEITQQSTLLETTLQETDFPKDCIHKNDIRFLISDITNHRSDSLKEAVNHLADMKKHQESIALQERILNEQIQTNSQVTELQSTSKSILDNVKTIKNLNIAQLVMMKLNLDETRKSGEKVANAVHHEAAETRRTLRGGRFFDSDYWN